MSGERDAAPARAGMEVSRTYILVMLTLVYVVNYLDRNILNQLLPSIQKEFNLSDADLGFLSGTVFAILYATLGVPLAWLADRANRRNVIAFSMMLFAAMTALSAYAKNFTQLVFARIGTGVGEAGTSPSVNSIISDLYEPKERAGALSFYATGLNIGLLLAFFGGGWIEQHYDWRTAFLAAGIPGLIIALLFVFTVPEPRRGAVEKIVDTGKTPHLGETVLFLLSRRSFVYIALGCGLASFGGYAGNTFVPSLFSRVFHLTPEMRGLLIGGLFGVVGGVGTYMSGVLADWLGKRDIRWNMYVVLCFIGFSLPLLPLYFLSDNLWIALAAGVLPVMNGAAYLAPSYAMVQSLVPLRMRAQAAALLLFTLNIIGFGTGPLLVGYESDLLKPMFGVDSIRWAMVSTMLTWALAGLCFYMASRSLKRELALANAPQAETVEVAP